MATFLHDTFTDTNGVNLDAHTGETGATWARVLGAGDCLVNTNRVYFETNATYASSGIPASADYHVVGDMYTAGLGTAGIGQIGVHVRVQGSAPTTASYGFLARHGIVPNLWSISRCANGIESMLVSSPGHTLAANTHYEMALQVVGSTLTAFVDGVQVLQVVNTTLTATGVAGMRSGQGNNATDGLLMDEITAADGPYTASNVPTISSIAPTHGPAAGGTEVVITGVNFTDTTEVSFGSEQADSFVEDSDTQITAVSPAGTEGLVVDVFVGTADGTSATSAGSQFTYDEPTSLWVPSTVRVRAEE